VFALWRRHTGTGSGNKSVLVASKNAGVEQVRIIFNNESSNRIYILAILLCSIDFGCVRFGRAPRLNRK
jgi:hypothetical protein